MISRLARSKAFTLLLACAGCSSTGGTRATGSTASTPCDPLTPPPTTLGPILGVGQDTQSILYVADEAPDGGGQQRVFVSSGTTLDRQHVLGSGSTPGQDSFSFEAPFADAGGARTLFIENPGGAVTAMALGSGSLRAPLAADAGETPLAVVDAGVVAAFEVQNLPAVVEHVGDVSNGQVIVVTAPMDAGDTSGFRLFYGPADKMIEYAIATYDDDDYGVYISFLVGSTTYNVFFNDPFEIDGGDGPGPGSLYTGQGAGDPALTTPPGALVVTERVPTPTSLSAFSFICSSP
jgi:hypothetical protein